MWGIQYDFCVSVFCCLGFMCTFFRELTKHGVLILVGEIWHCRNDYYHYFY